MSSLMKTIPGTLMEVGRTQASRRQSPLHDRWRWFRVFVMQTFLLHGVVFAVIMAMLLLINLLTWSGTLWMFVPLITWGSVVAVHGGIAFLVANAGVAGRMVDAAQTGHVLPSRKPRTARHEMQQLLAEGRSRLQGMRRTAKAMKRRQARSEAMATCSSIELVLVALAEHPDEVVLARDFVHAFMEPAEQIFVGYERLANRQISGVSATLREVEDTDLPRLRDKADEVLDRVHRGTVIDLDVAREMLKLTARRPALDDV